MLIISFVGHWYLSQLHKDWSRIFVQTRDCTLAVGLWIGLTNFFITLLCIIIGKYKYGNDTSDKHEFTTWNIALSHYLNTALIVMLA